MIILNERIELMEKGVLLGTGNIISMETNEGEKIQIEEPEEIHTYQGWKKINRQVKKGEKAIATILIWKHTMKKNQENEEKNKEYMFMTKAFFFKLSQTEKINN